HHIKVLNGSSAHKNEQKIDPGKMFVSGKIDKNKNKLIELMTTIALSKSSHGYVHAARRDSSLLDYDRSCWPFVLQNEENFNKICKILNLEDLNYQDFIKDLQ